MADARREQLRGQPDVARDVARVVDHGVPAATLKACELAVAVTLEPLDARKEVAVGTAAVEQRDGVAAAQGELRHVNAEKGRASEDQQAS